MLSLLRGYLQCVGAAGRCCSPGLWSLFPSFLSRISIKVQHSAALVASLCLQLLPPHPWQPPQPALGLAETPSLPSPLPAAPRARSRALFSGLLGDNLITPRLLSST